MISRDLSQKGFTLIETVIYFTLVVIVLVVSLNFAWNTVWGQIKVRNLREVQQNGRFSTKKIGYFIREAEGINYPSAGDEADLLSLEMADPVLDPTVIELRDDSLIVTQGANEPFEITNDNVGVEDLLFHNLSYSGTPGTIRVNFKVASLSRSLQGAFGESLVFRSTTSLLPGGATTSASGFCQGDVTSCTAFEDSTSCGNQDGCQWNLGECSGVCLSCKPLGAIECLSQEGCKWHFPPSKCTGKCTSCDNYTEESTCENQLGCTWGEPYCSGEAMSCENYDSEIECNSQDGCEWSTP